MKKIIVLLALTSLVLTSCVSKVTVEDPEEKVEIINEEKEEAPEKTPEEPVDEPEETPEEEPVEEPTETPEKEPTEAPEETPEEVIQGPALDENELTPKESDFTNITEDELEGLLENITGGQVIEFPIIPIN